MDKRLEEVLSSFPIALTEGQLTFIKDFIKGDGNFYLCGDQGSGKSTIMEVLSLYYKDEIIFCATSGIASVQMPNNIGAGTSHKVLSLTTEVSNDITIKKIKPPCQAIFGKSDLIKIVVVDEAFSWDSDNLFQAVKRKEHFDRKTAKRSKRNIRFLLVGDVLQRPPICDKVRKRLLVEKYGHWLMFRTKLWKEMDFTGHILTENKRQDTTNKEDKFFAAALKAIRYGEEERYPKLLQWLNKRVNSKYDKTSMYLAPTNSMVNSYNAQYLARNPNDKMTFNAVLSGKFDMKECPVEWELTLAQGVEVITLVNDQENRWQNGSNAVVEMMTTEGCYLKFDHSGETHFVPIYEFEAEETYIEAVAGIEEGSVISIQKRKKIGSCHMLPCKLSAGFTIARCQGRTFDKKGVVDVGTDWLYENEDMEDFMVAGLFVALSRFRSISQITLARPLKACNIKVCKDSLQFWNEQLAKQNS